MLILNEEQYADNLHGGKNNQIKSIVTKIGYITRYNLYVLGYSDIDNYQHTVQWMNLYHYNFDESCYSNLISDAIKRAHKTPFYKIDSIKITKSELLSIASLNDLRAEKVLFVLLCMAKHQRAIYGFTNGLVKYSIPELCKTARISVPSDDREYILYNIVKNGLLGYPKKNDTKCLMVNFINDEDDVTLSLDELDCQELAYAYLNWKNNGQGYGRCEYCGRLIKKSKNNPHRFCESCAEILGEVLDGVKVVKCIECGKPVYVSVFDSQTNRCEECYSTYRRQQKTETMRKLRAKE